MTMHTVECRDFNRFRSERIHRSRPHGKVQRKKLNTKVSSCSLHYATKFAPKVLDSRSPSSKRLSMQMSICGSRDVVRKKTLLLFLLRFRPTR